MPATFVFSESNTSGETPHDNIANLNFGSNDSYEIVTTTYPIVRGNASYEKYIRAKFTGSFSEISNMKFWKSSGTYVEGETLKAAANVAFVTPSQTPNADSDIPIIVENALSIQSAAGTATIITPGYTKYIRLQLRTTGSTPSGAVNQKIFCMQYDEV
jgi:hypothetical protein